jgi:hypothetical protein
MISSIQNRFIHIGHIGQQNKPCFMIYLCSNNIIFIGDGFFIQLLL